MHPILISIGSFRLPTYGMLFAMGLLGAIYTVVRLGKRENLDPGRLLDFSTWLLIVGLVGAKILYVVTTWGSEYRSMGDIFSWATLQSGGVFYGGFVAAVIFAVWYIRASRLPMLKIFDVYAPGIALAQSVGRLGCFAAGCDYGKATTSFLGVTFTSTFAHDLTGVPLGVRIYPTQIIESLATFIIFGILLWRYRRKAYHGQIFVIYLTLYAVARFFIEFLRGDEDRGFVFNHLLSTSQFVAILALIAAAGMVWKLRGRSPAVAAVSDRRELPLRAKRARS